jgi:hypothetical protein
MDSNLHIFQHELPDSGQELQIQHTSTFILFSELPLEIRQKIWRDTFPRVTHCILLYNARSGKSDLLHQKKTPIASRINQESRTETLRNYHVLEQKFDYPDSLPTLSELHCLFWNPTIDILKTEFYGVLGPTLRTYFNLQFDEDWDGFTLSVLLLKARHIYWYKEYNECVEKEECGLNDFKGLLNLDVTYPRNARKTWSPLDSAIWAAGGVKCLQSLNKHFRSSVLRGDRKVIPRVRIISEAEDK